MKERPILFKAEMVRAILEGRKTQTRRIVKFPKNVLTYSPQDSFVDTGNSDGPVCQYLHVPFRHRDEPDDGCRERLYPKWEIGEHLWVKETSRPVDHDFATDGEKEIPSAWLIEYKADKSNIWQNPPESERLSLAKKFGTANTTGGCNPRWRPSIFMHRWASRITLEIAGVRVERLNEISHRDALAEGVDYDVSKPDGAPLPRFKALWESINGKDSWKANPFVWVLEFKKL